MTPLDHLREQLSKLEDALGTAGLALLEAQQVEDSKEIAQLLGVYEIDRSRNRRRLDWLEQHGATLRWYLDQQSTGGN